MTLKILIIDDDPDALKLMTLFLQRKDHETITALDGKSGLDATRRENPDLIMLDIVLPDIDGYQVLDALRESKETRDIPIILISGIAGRGEKIKALQSGANAYLKRPFRPQDLFNIINEVLKK